LDLPVATVLMNPRQEWGRLAFGDGRVRVARDINVDWKSYTPDNYLFSHCTIVASVATEDNGYSIVPACSDLVNNNGNAWTNEVLLATFRTFVGGENYLEHVQVPELSKGKILDAVLRPLTYQDKEGRTADIYYCFTGDAKVLMGDGTEKDIQDVVAGDLVFSGDGNVQEVLAVSRKYASDIVRMKIRGDLDVVGCTTGHRIWAKENIEDEWEIVEAGSVGKDWWVFQPKPICRGDIEISKDMAWLVGFYAAEGSIVERADKDGIRHPKVTQFTCHQDEEAVVRLAIDIVLSEIGPYKVPFFTQRYSGEKLMRGIRGSVDSRKTSEFGVNIRVGHETLAEIMVSLCGRGSTTKKFHPDILTGWNDEAKLGFLAGLIDGDGYARRDVVGFKSSSNDMVRGVEFLLASLGMAYSTTGDWHSGPYSGCAVVELDCQSSDRLRTYLRIKNTFDVWSGELGLNNRASIACVGGIARRVASVEKVADTVEVPVYNIEVASDHSYIVSGIKVKNCDILVATNRKYKRLVGKIASGELTTMSMGCLADWVTCSRCGVVLGDNQPNCHHLDNELLAHFRDKKGVERVVAELCGRSIMKGGKRVGDGKSVRFIEASWVEKPAFYGAVLNHYVSEMPVEAARILEFPTDRLQLAVEDIFKLRVADKAGMMVLRVAQAEIARRMAFERVGRIARRLI
jgi:hypothetical protein